MTRIDEMSAGCAGPIHGYAFRFVRLERPAMPPLTHGLVHDHTTTLAGMQIGEMVPPSAQHTASFGSARSRALYARLLLMTIVLGLGSRRFGGMLPEVIARYAGDVLWATMVFWICALISPRAHTMRLASVAIGVSVAVEMSQLYRAPWLDALRANPIGALALGQGFLWSDLVCYAVGVTLGLGVDLLLRRRGAGVRSGP